MANAEGILYNFGANHGSINDIQGMLGNIQEVRQDISSIFATLLTVYEGDGATALGHEHQKIDSMLDEALNTTVNTHKQAADQQDAMAALDRLHGSSF